MGSSPRSNSLTSAMVRTWIIENVCSHCEKGYSIYYDPLSRSARRSFAPLQKSRRNLTCERKSYSVWYCVGARDIWYSVNIARTSVTINNRKTTHVRGVWLFFTMFKLLVQFPWSYRAKKEARQSTQLVQKEKAFGRREFE